MAVLSFRIGHHVVCVSKEEFKPSVMKNKMFKLNCQIMDLVKACIGTLLGWCTVYYWSHLKDVLPGFIYVSFEGEASHDHCMELRKLKRQKLI